MVKLHSHVLDRKLKYERKLLLALSQASSSLYGACCKKIKISQAKRKATSRGLKLHAVIVSCVVCKALFNVITL